MSVLRSIFPAPHSEREVCVSLTASRELGAEHRQERSSQESSGNAGAAEIGFLASEMCCSNGLSITRLSGTTFVSWVRCKPHFMSGLFGIKKLKPS